MKKTFALKMPGKNSDRIVEAVKNEYRKYLKRERRKPLPEGVDYWDFDCRFAQESDAPQTIHVEEISKCIDAAVQAQAEKVYIEILAKPGVRRKREKPSAAS